MVFSTRAQLQYRAALLQAEVDLLDANLHIVTYEQNRRRQHRQWRWWSRAWLSPERRLQFGLYDQHFGLYDQLMMEPRREDQRSFMNFMRMPTEMCDEILDRVGPRIAKQHTFWRAPLDPGMKLAITLRRLASGTKWLGLLALLWPGPSVPPASNKPSSCGSWTSAASGSVNGQLDLSQVSWPACSGLPLTAEGEGALKTGLPQPLPLPMAAFFDFPFGGISDVRLGRGKNCVTKFRFDGLFICAFSVT